MSSATTTSSAVAVDESAAIRPLPVPVVPLVGVVEQHRTLGFRRLFLSTAFRRGRRSLGLQTQAEFSVVSATVEWRRVARVTLVVLVGLTVRTILTATNDSCPFWS